MAQIIVNIPARLEAYIATKLNEGHASTESVVLAALDSARELEEESDQSLPWMDDRQRSALEATLESRMDGPFVPMRDDLVEYVMAKANSQLAQRVTAANA